MEWKSILAFALIAVLLIGVVSFDNLHFIKKRDTKHILKEECASCFYNYKDILEEIEN